MLVARSIHSWLGILLMPWIIFFGITGLYLNHQELVISWLPNSEYNEAIFRQNYLENSVSREIAQTIANKYWKDEDSLSVENVVYHDFKSLRFKKPSGYIIISLNTGHYYVKSNYRRSTFDQNGYRVHTKIYWPYIFGIFHRTGWINWRLQTVLADLSAIALVLFGVTGTIVWYLPKHRRIIRRLKKVMGEAK